MRNISLKEMEIIFNHIIAKLKEEGYTSIEINQDFYKYIPSDNWDSFEGNDVEYGSLFDDIEELKKLAEPANRICTYVDFDRLSSLLRAISQKNNPL